MKKLASLAAGFVRLLRTYPAMSGALLNAAVAILAYFGFHVTADQLTAYVTVTSVILGMLVHSNVMPMNKVVAINEANKAETSNVVVTHNGPTGILPPANSPVVNTTGTNEKVG